MYIFRLLFVVANLFLSTAALAGPSTSMETLDGWGDYHFGMSMSDVKGIASARGILQIMPFEKTWIYRVAVEADDPQILRGKNGTSIGLTMTENNVTTQREFGFNEQGHLTSIAIISTVSEANPAACIARHQSLVEKHIKHYPEATVEEGRLQTNWRRRTLLWFAEKAQSVAFTQYRPTTPETIGISGRCVQGFLYYPAGRVDPGEPAESIRGWPPFVFGMSLRDAYNTAIKSGMTATIKATYPDTDSQDAYLEMTTTLGTIPVKLNIDFSHDGGAKEFYLSPITASDEQNDCLAEHNILAAAIAQRYPRALYEGEQSVNRNSGVTTNFSQFRFFGDDYAEVFVSYNPEPHVSIPKCTAQITFISHEDKDAVDQMRARAVLNNLRDRGNPPS